MHQTSILQSQRHSILTQITSDFYVDKTVQLGRGNYGIVYKGFHVSANRIVAVKFISKKKLALCSDYQRQIVVMQDLAKMKHPNIMGYYGYESNKEGLYYFIEFCNGGTLKKLIKQKISQLKTLSLLKQMIEGMAYVNSQSTSLLILDKIHRDLKSQNILIDQNGELKIADFGLARDIEQIMTKGACTPLYAAPQVLNSTQYDQKCDVWSAGIILCEMLTNKSQIFDNIKTKSDLLKQLKKFDQPNYKIEIPKQLHPLWNQIIAKMLTYKVSSRPTFKQLKQYFKTIEPKMKNDLIEKYGEQKVLIQSYQHSLRLTKNISPYHQNRLSNPIKNMIQKFNEQKSFNNLNNLRKWFNFSRQKQEIKLILLRQFNSTQYDCIKNVHKYILMFLSICSYISRMISYSNQANKKKIITAQSVISQVDIVNVHANQYKQIVRQNLQKQQASISKYKTILQKQILAKLMDTYFKRPQQQKIIMSYDNLVNIFKQTKQGNYCKQQVYMSLFKKVANSYGVYFPDKLLKQLKYADLKVYTYIRVIARIDQVFLNNNYKNDDYLRSSKQQIQNATKEQLLQLSLKYNNTN